MLPYDKLKAVKTIITHDNCADGLMSAILLKDAYSQIGLSPEIKFVQYGTEAYKTLKPAPDVLFCDFSPFVPDIKVMVDGVETKVPDPEKLKPWVDSGQIILDHHKGAKAIVAAHGDLGVFGDEVDHPGISGAFLAFREVWLPFYYFAHLKGVPDEHDKVVETVESEAHTARDYAVLVGIRDTWQNKDPRWREACILAEVMRFYPKEEWLGDNRVLPFHPGNQGFWAERLKLGNLLWTKHEKTILKCLSKSWFYTSPKGTRVVIFQGTKQSSDVAEHMDQQADLIMSFDYECETPPETKPIAKKIAYSLRSHTNFDCMKFAKTLGGGGHTKAAGFSVAFHREAFDKEAASHAVHHAQSVAAILNPYSLAEVLVNRYEGDQQQGT